MSNEPLTVSCEESDWKLHGYEDITLKSPFELSEDKKGTVSKLIPGIGRNSQYSYRSRAMRVYLSRSEFTPTFPVNLDSAVSRAINKIEKLEGSAVLSYITEPIKKNDIKGRRIIAISQYEGDYTEIVAELYSDRTNLVQIIIIAPNNEENKLVSTRILSSLDFYL